MNNKLKLLTNQVLIDETYSKIKYRECRCSWLRKINFTFALKTNE